MEEGKMLLGESGIS
jgi:hypothetical protein